MKIKLKRENKAIIDKKEYKYIKTQRKIKQRVSTDCVKVGIIETIEIIKDNPTSEEMKILFDIPKCEPIEIEDKEYYRNCIRMDNYGMDNYVITVTLESINFTNIEPCYVQRDIKGCIDKE